MTEVLKLPLKLVYLPFKGRDSSFELTLVKTSRRDYWNGLGLGGEVWLTAEQMRPSATRGASDQRFW